MIQTTHLEQLAYEIQIGNHKLTTDVKVALGGKDDGPDPHELLEAALGACTSITVQMYANRKGWNLTSCSANIKFVQEDANAIVMERVLKFEGQLDDEQKTRLMQIADKCPIHQVLTRGVKIQSTFT